MSIVLGHSLKMILLCRKVYKKQGKERQKKLKLPLFYLANKEIQSRKFHAPFYAEFFHLQDKREGISKKILSFFTRLVPGTKLAVLIRFRS